MRDCNKYQDMIEDYLDNALTQDNLKDFDKHIKSCSSCSNELQFAKSVRTALKNTEFPDVPEDFLARVNYELDAEIYIPQKPRVYKFFNYRTFSAIAACLLIVAFLGINDQEQLTENITAPSATMPITGEQTITPTVSSAPQINTEVADIQAPVTADTSQVQENSTVSDTKPQQKKVPSANQVPSKSENSSQTKTDIAPKTRSVQPTEEHIPMMAALSIEDEVSSPEAYQDTATTSGGGGGSVSGGGASSGGASSGGASAKKDDTSEEGNISVKENDYTKVKQIASRYSSAKNGVYKMSSETYSEFLDSLDSASVEYQASVSDDGTVEFTISEN